MSAIPHTFTNNHVVTDFGGKKCAFPAWPLVEIRVHHRIFANYTIFSQNHFCKLAAYDGPCAVRNRSIYRRKMTWAGVVDEMYEASGRGATLHRTFFDDALPRDNDAMKTTFVRRFTQLNARFSDDPLFSFVRLHFAQWIHCTMVRFR
jgi:hypothetical protein